MSYQDHVDNVEELLYQALEALEDGDLITVRQCSAKAQSETTLAWQERRKEEKECTH